MVGRQHTHTHTSIHTLAHRHTNAAMLHREKLDYCKKLLVEISCTTDLFLFFFKLCYLFGKMHLKSEAERLDMKQKLRKLNPPFQATPASVCGCQGIGESLGGGWRLCLLQVPRRQAWSPRRAPHSPGSIWPSSSHRASRWWSAENWLEARVFQKEGKTRLCTNNE